MSLTLVKVPRRKLLGKTIDLIKSLSWDAKKRPAVRQIAVKILQNAGINDSRDRQKAATALASWTATNLKFINDPWKTEMLHTPERTLALGYADCDDMSIFMAATLMSIGIPARFVVEGVLKPEHIYIQALTEKGWRGFDPAAGPNDPPPSMTKIFLITGYTGDEKMIGQLMTRKHRSLRGYTMTQPLVSQLYKPRPRRLGQLLATRNGMSPYEAGALGQIMATSPGLSPYESGALGNMEFGGFAQRSKDPITQVGTAVEREAGGIPVIIRATQATEATAPDVGIVLLPAVNPKDISHYQADAARGVIYPVLKKYARSQRDAGLGGYDQVAGFDQFGGLGWVFKKAVSLARKVKKIGKRAIKRIKRTRPGMRVEAWRLERGAKKAARARVAAKTPAGKLSTLAKLKKIGMKPIDAIRNAIASARGSGELSEEEAALIESQLAAGDIEGAEETGAMLAPATFGNFTEGLPPWALPAAIAAGAFIAFKKGWI